MLSFAKKIISDIEEKFTTETTNTDNKNNLETIDKPATNATNINDNKDEKFKITTEKLSDVDFILREKQPDCKIFPENVHSSQIDRENLVDKEKTIFQPENETSVVNFVPFDFSRVNMRFKEVLLCSLRNFLVGLGKTTLSESYRTIIGEK